jgi:hypothetical protein
MSSWQSRRRAQILSGLAGITRSVGSIIGNLYNAARVNQVNQGMAFLERSFQEYFKDLPTKSFQVPPEQGMFGAEMLTRRLGEVDLSIVEQDYADFLESQIDYIEKNVTNRDARTELLHRLEMGATTQKNRIFQAWGEASEHVARANLDNFIKATIDSDAPWEHKVLAISERLDEMVATGRLWKDEAERIKASAVATTQELFAYQGALNVLQNTENPVLAEAWIVENTPFWAGSPEKRAEVVDEAWRQWGVREDRKNFMLRESIDRIELDYMDRTQAGNPPTWAEIRSSDLPRERKQYWRDLINRIAEDKRQAEKDRQKEIEDMREEARQERISQAYFQAYSEIVDWPMGEEEQVEDRILGDPDLTNEQRKQLIDEYRKRSDEAERAAQQKGPLEVTDPAIHSELVRMFYDFEKYANDEVESYIKSHQGKGLSITDARTWLDRTKRRDTYRSKKILTDMVTAYFDDVIQYETDPAKILKARGDEAEILILLDDAINSGEYTEQGLYELVRNAIVESKEGRVRRSMQALIVEEPDKKKPEGAPQAAISAAQEYAAARKAEEAPPETAAAVSAAREYAAIRATEEADREMIDTYIEWKGVPPVLVRKNAAGEISFFDGTWWYVYRRDSWYRWDGNRWRISTK